MAIGPTVQLLTIVEAARHLGISRSKVYELLADGELPSVSRLRGGSYPLHDVLHLYPQAATIRGRVVRDWQ
jgi:excisionase family DNA binding protein